MCRICVPLCVCEVRGQLVGCLHPPVGLRQQTQAARTYQLVPLPAEPAPQPQDVWPTLVFSPSLRTQGCYLVSLLYKFQNLYGVYLLNQPQDHSGAHGNSRGPAPCHKLAQAVQPHPRFLSLLMPQGTTV